MDDIIWVKCSGVDIGYFFGDIDEKTDCLLLTQSGDNSQIDCEFINRNGLIKENHYPQPFGFN